MEYSMLYSTKKRIYKSDVVYNQSLSFLCLRNVSVNGWVLSTDKERRSLMWQAGN